MLQKLMGFINNLKSENLQQMLKKVVEKKTAENQGGKNIEMPFTSEECPKPILPKSISKKMVKTDYKKPPEYEWQPFDKPIVVNSADLPSLIDLHPQEVARQLTLIEFQFFKEIKVISF